MGTNKPAPRGPRPPPPPNPPPARRMLIEVTTFGDAKPRYVMGYEPPPARRAEPRPASKCPSCGSREWDTHNGREVCSYCRSDR